MIGVNKWVVCFVQDQDGSPPLSNKVTNNATAYADSRTIKTMPMFRLMLVCLFKPINRDEKICRENKMKVWLLTGTMNPSQKTKRQAEVNTRLQAEKMWKALPAEVSYGCFFTNARQWLGVWGNISFRLFLYEGIRFLLTNESGQFYTDQSTDLRNPGTLLCI